MNKPSTHPGSTTTSTMLTHRGRVRSRRLPTCPATGLPCFDERRQAGDAVKAARRGGSSRDASAFRCEHCTRWHVRVVEAPRWNITGPLAIGRDRPRAGRIIVLDIENATLGGRGGVAGAADYIAVLRGQALQISNDDMVIVAAARQVVRAFREVLTGSNVTWLAGDDQADGADRAALAWVRLNLRRLAAGFEELVLVTGDHSFSVAARRGQKYGLRVRVVTTEHPTGRSTLSRRLADAAHVRTTIRLRSRSQQLRNRAAVHQVAGRTHRRVHAEAGAA